MGRKNNPCDFSKEQFSKSTERDNERQRAKRRRENQQRDKKRHYEEENDYDEE